jgi:transposase
VSLWRLFLISVEDCAMMQSGMSEVRRVRRWRSVTEKRQIVQLTMEPGASVAEVAREHGVNANQVFKWRRAWERGELTDGYAALLPVTVSSSVEPENKMPALPSHEQLLGGGSIHVELPGRALISVERGADPDLVRCIVESVCK